VAFVVLAAGTAAVAQLQSHLRLAGDVARDRSEAVRLGQDAMEAMRSFIADDGPPGVRSYASIASGSAVAGPASSPRAHGEYAIERRVDDLAFAGSKATSVSVRWSDRSGSRRELTLHSFVAGGAPAYAGSLGLDVGAMPSTPRGAHGRAPTIPITARNLGNGRSAWKPVEGGTTALVFDNASGTVVGRCDGIAAATATRDLTDALLGSCASGRWLLASGTIRFSASAGVLSSTGVRIALADGAYPAQPACFNELQKTVRYVVAGSIHIADVGADATPAGSGLTEWEEEAGRFMAWHCVVSPRADGRWSGRIGLVASGWTLGTGSADHRVCRFVGARPAGPNDANIAAAGDETDVGAALIGRNFLIVGGGETCPSEPRTEQHQP
jgi:hypothetical protein